ncbi:hypothetical protein DMC30DRAFT_447825 [Rhodotorula diobovata]|uniref:BZIP domain-containing protein n=1 Tax=Rhodotorula diobovata TaxID=5288 RepID=A0A5C5FRR9_9BASI|nr:hypothetical protein DMC30DRAFT_447825 [Rhodotorula diobovata]
MDSPSPRAPSSRKRTATSAALDMDHDAAEEGPAAAPAAAPAKKKRAPRSTAAEKQAKKLARMERNRLAAQVSRDKKRHQAEFLEARVAELEAQLVQGGGSPSPSSSSAGGFPPTPASVTMALPSTVTTAAPALARDPLVERLQEENESLKTQLALERLQSQSLQIRLSALESKFGRLERLLTVPPVVPSFTPAVDVNSAADVPLDLDALLALDFGPSAPVAASDPGVDQGLAPLADADVAQAWADWASGIDLASLEAPQPTAVVAAAPAPVEAHQDEFDLFEFLRQDATAAPEAVC